MLIRKYEDRDSKKLFDLMSRESDEWEYAYEENQERYKKVMNTSIAYIVEENGKLQGYIRCHRDEGFGIYVYDLLVDQQYRGRSYGKLLIEKVCEDYPSEHIYVMSDVDLYYEKQGYEKIGSIFLIQ